MRRLLLFFALTTTSIPGVMAQFGSSMSFGGGLGLFHGDIEHEGLLPKTSNNSEYKPSFSFWLNQDISPAVDLSVGVGGAMLAGTHETREVGVGYTPGAYFTSLTWEGGVQISVRPLGFFPAMKISSANVGLSFQTGFMGYQSKLYRLADEQPFTGTEENQGPTSEGLDFIWGYGFFAKRALNDNMDIGFSYGLRNLIHDQLDAYVGGTSNDKYSYLQVTYTYTFMNAAQKEKKNQPGGPGVTGKARQQDNTRKLKWTHQSPTR